MDKKNIWQRFYIYQKERFPFAILIFTTLSVILSSFAVVIDSNDSLRHYLLEVIIGTITGLLFTFHMRVMDDIKDNHFDQLYHLDRPIQRGVISIRELKLFNRIGLFFQIIINFIFSFKAFLWLAGALIYSLIAKKEFFMSSWIRKRFFLYNSLNLLQLFFVQLYVYALVNPDFSLKNILLTIHFVFVICNAATLEFARKMKSSKEENAGRDTYSSRLGPRLASLVYSCIYFIVYALFLSMFFLVSKTYVPLYLSFIFLSLMILATLNYTWSTTKISTKIIEGTAILFYLSMHLLLVAAVI